MRDLNYQLKQLCARNRDGSFATRHDRERLLDLIAHQLHELGFRHMQTSSLKPRHVERLVERWRGEGLGAGTIKNRMAALRWWAEKIGKPGVVASRNDHYGIAERTFVTNCSKAREISESVLARVGDPWTAMSLRLQAAFGLRRSESIKIQPSWADRGDVLVLKGSWTKGGREREVPIRAGGQRALLDEAKRLAAGGSLIPREMTYVQQLRRFEHQCARAGIHQVHGHRHHYAQSRYLALTGWPAPAAGGPTSKQLTAEQKVVDRAARLQISAELGHGRLQVVAIYCGT
ncbi:MAG: integrase [Betaproteobacteria bacterium]|nr:integrase [Betaproteobacteria bacterium]